MSDLPATIGGYEIIRELGRGATSVVYLARENEQAEPVALKYVRLSENREARSKRRLLKLLKAEEYAAQKLDHPSIIRIFEVVLNDEDAWVVMEYFAGKTLDEYCQPGALMSAGRAVGIVLKCCLALEYASKQGVVHRDIKPSNIMVDEHDNVKITDFGLALHLNRKAGSDSTFITGVGSPAYMSPEQIKGHPLNQQTDIYSLGVMLFYLLCGRLPFRAANAAQMMYQIINTEPPLVSLLNPSLPQRFDTILQRALARDTYSRYRHASDFAQDLSTLRYQLVDEEKKYRVEQYRFDSLQAMPLLQGLDDVQLWELAHLAAWRRVEAGNVLYEQGAHDQRFGLIIEGEVEIRLAGRPVAWCDKGDVFGELAALGEARQGRPGSDVARTLVRYAEINPAALALATEELQAYFQRLLAQVLVRRYVALASGESANAQAANEGGADTAAQAVDAGAQQPQ